jgi:hypothetical protein
MIRPPPRQSGRRKGGAGRKIDSGFSGATNPFAWGMLHGRAGFERASICRSRLPAQPKSIARNGPAAKQIQAKPNKSKQKALDLLGFIRPNRDFSMGYGGFK